MKYLQDPWKLHGHSVQKHKLVYSQYLGDDDTSSFKEVPS